MTADHDWFDVLPAEAQQIVKAHEDIVRELAEGGPCRDGDGWCAHCFQSYDSEPHHHAVDCIWRRACELCSGCRS